MKTDLGLFANSNIDDQYFYKKWLEQQKEGYFLMSNSIEEYLPLIKSPAMNLYLFYAIHAKNKEGSSFYGTDKIAKILHVSKKTLTNWNSILQNAGLITRIPVPNASTITQLRPTSDFTIDLVDKDAADKVTIALAQDGFKIQTVISYILLSSKKQSAKFLQFKRAFGTKSNSINRFVTLKYPIPLSDFETLQSPNEPHDLAWIDESSSAEETGSGLTIVSTNDKNDVPSILEQLRTPETISEFKKVYPKL